MKVLPSDLHAVATVNPVPGDAVAGERESAQARELREQLLGLTEQPMGARQRSRRVLALVVAVVAAVIVGSAIGARLLTGNDVERYLPQGSLAFSGTEPQCAAIESGVAYRCRLARSPTKMTVTGADGARAFKGAKFGTVDDDNRVNGGCVGLNNAGTEWACYVGQRAVSEGIVDPGVLGQEQGGPAGG